MQFFNLFFQVVTMECYNLSCKIHQKKSVDGPVSIHEKTRDLPIRALEKLDINLTKKKCRAKLHLDIRYEPLKEKSGVCD